MFAASSNAAVGVKGRLRALRLSLNSPVVVIEELPVGPASAGIALHEGPRGSSLCLAVRSVRTGQLALFTPDENPEAGEVPCLGVDAALSFAESMGFLFDEDLMASGDPQEGARRWAELRIGAASLDCEEAEGGAGRLPPVLSKFRLQPLRVPVAEVATAGEDELWLRWLSRF